MRPLEFCGVCKAYGEKRVVRDFDLTAEPGESVILMGKSGCGKTTLLHLAAGLRRPDAGTITGVPERIAMVFQEDRLCGEFSPVWNIRLAVNRPESEIRAHLEELGLTAEADCPAETLSGGMKRRVAVARAVLYGGDLLLLDEAFRGLDRATLRQTTAYVRRHCAGKTILCATHDETVAALLGGHIVRLDAPLN